MSKTDLIREKYYILNKNKLRKKDYMRIGVIEEELREIELEETHVKIVDLHRENLHINAKENKTREDYERVAEIDLELKKYGHVLYMLLGRL